MCVCVCVSCQWGKTPLDGRPTRDLDGMEDWREEFTTRHNDIEQTDPALHPHEANRKNGMVCLRCVCVFACMPVCACVPVCARVCEVKMQRWCER